MQQVLIVLVSLMVFVRGSAYCGQLSEETEACLVCHTGLMPGIYNDWRKSRHSRITPAQASGIPVLQRRISTDQIPSRLSTVVVGCAECHLAGEEDRGDTFLHNGYKVHTIVTPRDCAQCHPQEVKEFGENLMSHAHQNLKGNKLFSLLADSINGPLVVDDARLSQKRPDEMTESDSCLSCHGTKVEVVGTRTRETSMGPMDFPNFRGWPNQGVGRVNPDGSVGSCSACHTRHSFSIELARKPYTCSQCHKGPDVPAYPVFQVSKHGNIYESKHHTWDFQEVPWVAGKHFQAPTCATCHVSLLVDTEGEVIAPRTHRMSDRLPWRLFGLIYSHPHPVFPDTTKIRNKSGFPLPTELTGEPVTEATITEEELLRRLQVIKGVCTACHSAFWIDGHFDRLKHIIHTTNEATRSATMLLMEAWREKLAFQDNPFDEPIEKRWIIQWLFFSNSTRFASAMGGADYGVFANGRWDLSRNISEMWEWIKLRKEVSKDILPTRSKP